MTDYKSRGKCKFLLKCHLIFVVKYRKKLLVGQIANRIKCKIKSLETSEFEIITMEVDKDHIHMMIDYVPQISVGQIVRRLKQCTTIDIWKNFETRLRLEFWKENTFWSDGYFVASTGDASTETVRKYIENQG